MNGKCVNVRVMNGKFVDVHVMVGNIVYVRVLNGKFCRCTPHEWKIVDLYAMHGKFVVLHIQTDKMRRLTITHCPGLSVMTLACNAIVISQDKESRGTHN